MFLALKCKKQSISRALSLIIHSFRDSKLYIITGFVLFLESLKVVKKNYGHLDEDFVW